MNRSKLDSIIEVASQVLSEGGYECIEAEWDAGGRILRLFVDVIHQSHSGMNLEECVKATKLLDTSHQLDEAISGPFTLEVSSPGVERPLRRLKDFERFMGQVVEVKLLEKSQDRKHGKGRITKIVNSGAEGVSVILDTQRGSWQFPFASLQRANLVYDWGNS